MVIKQRCLATQAELSETQLAYQWYLWLIW